MKKTTTKLWLVITPVSLQPHQYMLFDGGMRHSVNSYSSLFNQGPNSPKFHGNPPHFVFTLHPSVFLHRYYHVTAQRLHQSYSHGSCKFNASLYNNLIFLMFFFFYGVVTIHLLLYFSSTNQQIRKLRRELDASQEKVATLTSQLTANVSLFTSKDAV